MISLGIDGGTVWIHPEHVVVVMPSRDGLVGRCHVVMVGAIEIPGVLGSANDVARFIDDARARQRVGLLNGSLES